MSLDVTLTMDAVLERAPSTGVFVRDNGASRELTEAEVLERWPNWEPVIVEAEPSNEVYSANITHNLGKMAQAAGIYQHLWRPEELGITKAGDLIAPLEKGLADLKARPEYFSQFNAPNGWGLYKHFVPFVEQYLAACKDYPTATVHARR